jgi:alpha-1,6-mannosyltransferase
MPWGRIIEVRAPSVPGSGYRVITDTWRLPRILDRLAPDRLEVHDRLTLRRLGRWASRRGVPSLVVSHERLDQVLAQWLPALAQRHLPAESVTGFADWSNRALGSSFDAVVCTTAWAAEEFTHLDGVRLERVPLGVDLDHFSRVNHSTSARAHLAAPDEVLLLMSTRLSREKAPGLALEALRSLRSRGIPARLVVAGHGPMRPALESAAAGLPATFLGYVSNRDRLAQLLSSADVVLAPGPVETFGLAALEALASGTPVVANAASALPEVLGDAGICAAGTPTGFADAVEQLLFRPESARRSEARRRAEEFPWSATVAGFLAVHRLDSTARRAAA